MSNENTGSSSVSYKPMTSEEARIKTVVGGNKNYEHQLQRVYDRIHWAAEEGFNICTFGEESPANVGRLLPALAIELRRNGYTVEEHRKYTWFGSVYKLDIKW